MVEYGVTLRETTWRAPPNYYSLSGDEVHVWRAAIDWPAGSIAYLEQILSPDEKIKSGRFYFVADRRRFVIGRGVLRVLLGRYLKVPPAQLRLEYGQHGKPLLRAGLMDKRLNFNVSHSGEFILIAIALARAVGVDVERIRRDIPVHKLAARFFSAHERDALARTAANAQYDAFFTYWTHKEAYLKATGDGLSLPLDRFHVVLRPDQSSWLEGPQNDLKETSRWTLRELAPGCGYKAALAVEGSSWELRCWDCSALQSGLEFQI